MTTGAVNGTGANAEGKVCAGFTTAGVSGSYGGFWGRTVPVTGSTNTDTPEPTGYFGAGFGVDPTSGIGTTTTGSTATRTLPSRFNSSRGTPSPTLTTTSSERQTCSSGLPPLARTSWASPSVSV